MVSRRHNRNQLPRWLYLPAGLAAVFLILPVVGIFSRIPWASLGSVLTTDAAIDALWLSLRTCVASTVIAVALGCPVAIIVARSRGRWVKPVRTLLTLPMVLPPVVAGIALLVTFGRFGLVGSRLSPLGIEIGFTTVAVVLAQVFVSMPFLVMAVEAATRTLDEGYERAAASLGARPSLVFWRVTLPLLSPAITSGAALAFARALGEFGATLTFAGSLQGTTRTLPLEIYLARETDSDIALTLALVLFIVAGLIVGFTTIVGRNGRTVRHFATGHLVGVPTGAAPTGDAPTVAATTADTTTTDTTTGDTTTRGTTTDTTTSDTTATEVPTSNTTTAEVPTQDTTTRDTTTTRDVTTGGVPNRDTTTCDTAAADVPADDSTTGEDPTSDTTTSDTPTADTVPHSPRLASVELIPEAVPHSTPTVSSAMAPGTVSSAWIEALSITSPSTTSGPVGAAPSTNIGLTSATSSPEPAIPPAATSDLAPATLNPLAPSICVHATCTDRGLSYNTELPAGRVTAITGPNGCGKTTLLQLISGELLPDSGTVQIGTQIVADETSYLPTHQRSVALLSQKPLLFPNMTVIENVAFGLRATGGSRGEAIARARRELDVVGCLDLAHRRSWQLSGGQAQKVSLARALAVDPNVVLLDEPFAALDAESVLHLRAVMKQRLRGQTTLLVTHDPDDVSYLADQTMVLPALPVSTS